MSAHCYQILHPGSEHETMCVLYSKEVTIRGEYCGRGTIQHRKSCLVTKLVNEKTCMRILESVCVLGEGGGGGRRVRVTVNYY